MVAASSPSFLCKHSPFLGSKPAVDRASAAATVCIRFRSSTVTGAYATTGSATTSPYLCSSMASASASLYEVLGIPMGASYEEIKIAYRRLARVCHPDVVAMNLKDKSADEFMKIRAAYSTLSDPAKRADYDRKLFTRIRSSSSSFSTSASAFRSPAVSGFTGYTRRTWETDQCW